MRAWEPSWTAAMNILGAPTSWSSASGVESYELCAHSSIAAIFHPAPTSPMFTGSARAELGCRRAPTGPPQRKDSVTAPRRRRLILRWLLVSEISQGVECTAADDALERALSIPYMLDVSTRESESGEWVCRLEYP